MADHGGFAGHLEKRELLMRLVMAEVVERRGQGPLARRFSLPRAVRKQAPEQPHEPTEKA